MLGLLDARQLFFCVFLLPETSGANELTAGEKKNGNLLFCAYIGKQNLAAVQWNGIEQRERESITKREKNVAGNFFLYTLRLSIKNKMISFFFCCRPDGVERATEKEWRKKLYKNKTKINVDTKFRFFFSLSLYKMLLHFYLNGLFYMQSEIGSLGEIV